MTLIVYYIVHFIGWRSETYLEDGKRFEYESVAEARQKIKELENKYSPKLFAWKREEINY